MAAHADQVEGLARGGSAVRPAHLAYGLIAVSIGVLWPSVLALSQIWRDVADYEHGWLVAFVVIVWLAKRRVDLDVVAVRPVYPALLPLALVLIAWAVSYRANSELMQQILLPLVPMLVVLSALGREAALRVALPLSYLYFAIPLWDHAVPLLQSMTTAVTEQLLGVIGVPTVVDGNTVTIPEGQFTIAEGCAGKRYLVIALAFALLVGVVQRLPRRRLALLLASTAALALVTNWLRVGVIVVAGHFSNMQHYLVAREHVSFGWVLFAVLLIAIGWLARRLASDALPAAEPAIAHRGPGDQRRVAWLAPVLLLLLPLVMTMPSRNAAHPPVLSQLPVLTGAWQGPMPADAALQPRFAGMAGEQIGRYVSSAGDVQIYMNVYGRQTQGHELVFYKNSVLPSDRWSALTRRTRAGDVLSTTIAIDPTGGRWVIAEAFKVGPGLTPHPAIAQLFYGTYGFWRPVPAGAIVIASRCLVPDCASATDLVQVFWRDQGTTLAGLIPAQLQP